MEKKEKVIYRCICGMDFGNKKDNYIRHINKKKKCTELHRIAPNSTEKIENCTEQKEIKNDNKIKNTSKYICIYCNNTFTRQTSLNRHLEDRCKNKPETTLNNMLTETERENNKLIELDEKYNKILKQYDEIKNENAKLKKRMKKTKKTPITIINQNNVIVNQNNILVNHNDIDLKKLDKKLFIQPLLNNKIIGKQKILKTIENVYINDDYPENHNIIVSDKNRGYVKIYNDGEWKTYNFEPIDNLIDGVINQSKNIIFEIKEEFVLKNIKCIYIKNNHPKYNNFDIDDKKQPSLFNKYIAKKQDDIKIFDDGEWKITDKELINMIIDDVLDQSKYYTIEMKQEYNKGTINTLKTSEKYINYCDSEYLENLEEQQHEGKDNNNLIKRCKDFRKMVHKDTINLLHDKKKTLLKTQKNNNKIIELK